MENITIYYYACLQDKTGKITRKRFTDRNAARDYNSKNFNPAIHTACWTE